MKLCSRCVVVRCGVVQSMKGWGERTKLVSLQRFTRGGQCDRRHYAAWIWWSRKGWVEERPEELVWTIGRVRGEEERKPWTRLGGKGDGRNVQWAGIPSSMSQMWGREGGLTTTLSSSWVDTGSSRQSCEGQPSRERWVCSLCGARDNAARLYRVCQ